MKRKIFDCLLICVSIWYFDSFRVFRSKSLKSHETKNKQPKTKELENTPRDNHKFEIPS